MTVKSIFLYLRTSYRYRYTLYTAIEPIYKCILSCCTSPKRNNIYFHMMMQLQMHNKKNKIIIMNIIYVYYVDIHKVNYISYTRITLYIAIKLYRAYTPCVYILLLFVIVYVPRTIPHYNMMVVLRQKRLCISFAIVFRKRNHTKSKLVASVFCSISSAPLNH